MEEGNKVKGGNIKLLRKKEPTKPGKEDTRQKSRDQSLEPTMCKEKSYC